MEFGPPKINEVFDMQGKKKKISPPGKKARGLSHAPQCILLIENFCILPWVF